MTAFIVNNLLLALGQGSGLDSALALGLDSALVSGLALGLALGLDSGLVSVLVLDSGSGHGRHGSAVPVLGPGLGEACSCH